VEVLSLEDPAPHDSDYTPDDGTRFVTARVTLANLSTNAIDGSFEAVVVDETGQQWTPEPGRGPSECARANVNTGSLLPNTTATGCFLVQIPDARQPTRVVIATGSASSQIGTWYLSSGA
jgi:hypothetical protein